MRKTVILTALLGMMIPAFGQAEGNLQKAKSEMNSTPLPFACVKSTTYVQPVVPFTPEGDARTYAFSYKDLNGEAQNNNEERNCAVFRRFELGTADLLVVAVARSASTKHFLVSYKEGVPVDYLECAFSFNNDIAMKQWRIDAEGEIQISALKVKEGRQVLFEEEDIAVIFVGHMSELAEKVRMELKDTGYACSLVNARFVKPLDTEMLEKLAEVNS